MQIALITVVVASGCTKEARMRIKAERGSPKEMYEFGIFLRQEAIRKRNNELLIEGTGWIEKAAGNGYSEAMLRLGGLYSTGHRVEDCKMAVFWYTRAAECGNRIAMASLGQAYRFGQLGLPKDEAKAAYWYLRAQKALDEEKWGPTRAKAKSGDAEAQRTMGGRAEALHSEEGDREAVTWYTKAAEAGDRDARMRLANIYGNGELGQQKDSGKSQYWFEKWQESLRAEKKR